MSHFAFQNNKLCYSKRSGEDVTVMEEDLRICLVRPLMDIDRRYCFEVISPTKSHILQADSEEIAKVRKLDFILRRLLSQFSGFYFRIGLPVSSRGYLLLCRRLFTRRVRAGRV